MAEREWVSASEPYLAAGNKAGSDAWGAEAAARGHRGSQRIARAGEVAASEAVARMLGISAGDAVVVRRRVMYLDDRPCELTDSYYPLPVAQNTALARTAKIPGGAVRLLAELGHAGVRAREDVTARMPDADERQELELPEGEPVLCLARTTFDLNDQPVQADMMIMPAALQRLRYEIRIG
ncbi:GntR family transcriptional regulator [Streptomyces sp. NPDC054861]